MSVKYHISPVTGKPERCTATKRPCKYGGADKHYSSLDAANKAAEAAHARAAGDNAGRLVKKSRRNDKFSRTTVNDNEATSRMYLTVLDDDGKYLNEGDGSDLGSALLPGEYRSYVYDEDSDTDKLVKLTVHDDGTLDSVTYDDADKSDYRGLDFNPPENTYNSVGAKLESTAESFLKSANNFDSYGDEDNHVYAMKRRSAGDALRNIVTSKLAFDDYVHSNRTIASIIELRDNYYYADDNLSHDMARSIDNALPRNLRIHG